MAPTSSAPDKPRREPRVIARMVIETVTTFARHIYRDVEPPAFELEKARADIIATLVAGIVVPEPRRRSR